MSVFANVIEGVATKTLVTRIALCGLGAIACLWGLTTFPIFWSESTIDKIGGRIASGEPFKRESLLALRPQLDALEHRAWPTPESLHNVALIELRLAELELGSGSPIAGNAQFERAQIAIESALRAVPSDGFMWFALFWLTKTRDGYRQESLPYLRMSYRVAPHEGWIAVRRNRVAVSILSILPADLAETVITEFRNLVSSGFVEPAAEILTGPGWGNRELLLTGLANAPEDARRQLADAIYDRGFDVTIPGVERRGQRPWR
ncbi:MAG: hypothetical protein WCB34_03760 [Methylovirgula sp.]